MVNGSPAVGGETVYFGSRDSHLYAVDLKTGNKLWTFKAGGWIRSSPVVAGKKVLFGADDGKFYVLQ
jgi:outer membrane protein assembly factor BamB